MSAEIVRKLSALGLNLEQVAGVMEIMDAEAAKFEAAEEARKAQVRERVQRWRDRQKDDVTLPKRNGNATKRLTRVEDSSSSKDISGQEKKKDAPAATSPCQELESVLDTEHARAVVDHRQRLRKPLTAYAARKLANMLAKHADPNAAADKMIESGWLKIEPHWGKQQGTSPPSSKPLTQGESLRNMAREAGVIDDTGNPIRRVETGDRDREDSGAGDVIRLAVAGNHRW